MSDILITLSDLVQRIGRLEERFMALGGYL